MFDRVATKSGLSQLCETVCRACISRIMTFSIYRPCFNEKHHAPDVGGSLRPSYFDHASFLHRRVSTSSRTTNYYPQLLFPQRKSTNGMFEPRAAYLAAPSAYRCLNVVGDSPQFIQGILFLLLLLLIFCSQIAKSARFSLILLLLHFHFIGNLGQRRPTLLDCVE